MSDNVTDTLNQIQKAFDELKATNEQKLGEMATRGSVDTLIESKLAAINETITDLEKKAARPNLSAAGETEVEVEHKSAWNAWARKGRDEDGLREIERKAVTITGTDTAGLAAGGVLMPKNIEAGIYRALETLSPIRQEATVITVSSDDYRFLGGAGDFEANWVGETDARPETATGTLSETRVPMGELYAMPAASQRALDDVAFDLGGYMEDEIARAFAKKETAAFIAGDGVNKPLGMLSTTGLPFVKTGAASALPASADAYIAMIYALPAAYRNGAKFVMASTTQASVRTLKDSTGGYIWQPSLVEGQPSTLAGYGIVTAEEMPAVAANSLSAVFGNIKQGYLIVDRIGIRTLRDPYSKKPYVLFYTTKRVGGMVKDKQAFVALKTAA